MDLFIAILIIIIIIYILKKYTIEHLSTRHRDEIIIIPREGTYCPALIY